MDANTELENMRQVFSEIIKDVKPKHGFRMEILMEESYENTLNYLSTDYFPDENIYKTFKVIRSSEVDDFYLNIFKQNISIICIDIQTENIAGVSLNSILSQEGEHKKLSSIEDKHFRDLFEFERFGDADVNLFDRYKVSKAVMFNTLSVGRRFRNNGLASWMLQSSFELVKCLGYKAGTVSCSTVASKVLFQRLGFEVLFERRYADWLKDGKCPFTNVGNDDSEIVYGLKF